MNLDWKWIGYGVLIMFGLSFLVGIVFALMIGPDLANVADPADIEITGGQMAIAALLNFLAFAVGGYIVGIKSAGKTIVEPAIAAAIAVAIGLLISGSLTIGNLVAAGLVPFLAGLLGGWLGERRQESRSVP